MTAKTDFGVAGARVLRTMKALSGHSTTGLTNVEIAESIGETPSNVVRALNTLISEDLARQLETGRYALSVAMLRIAREHFDHMRERRDAHDDLTRRVG